MALVVSSNIGYDEKSRRSSFRGERKPWMLRDYLRDDLSSCSSNGFKSFPRKQCCAVVKNIIEKEVSRKSGRSTPNSKPPKKMALVRSRSVSSALQRASMAVINAVKLFPFSSAVKSSGGGSGRRLLPRSFSKKMFKRSFFWKKSGEKKAEAVAEENKIENVEECDEIERWISSGVVATEKYQPLDLSNDTTVTNASSTSNSNTTSSDGKSSDSWSDITFTSDYLTSVSENDAVERREKLFRKSRGGGGGGGEEEEVISKSVGVSAADDSADDSAVTKSTWCNEEAEKEQLSPISVMDFPYNGDGSASPFTLRVSRFKGTTERLMEKLDRFESLAAGIGLEPVNLESLMSSIETEDHSPKHSILSCSTPSFILSNQSDSEDEEEEEEESQEDETEKRVQHLLHIMKQEAPTTSTYKFEHENLLLDFFRENVMDKEDDTLQKSAEDWINGHYDKLILGWEVKDKRQAYIRDMEERGRWPKDANLEKEEVAIELGGEVLETLIEEIILEIC